MYYIIRKLLVRSSLLLVLHSTAGCKQNTAEVSLVYNKYTFDLKVNERLPLYDSLVNAIIEKRALFESTFDKNEAYEAFRYMPTSYETEVYKRLPPEAGTAIDYYYTKLGKDFIFGFDIFKDSTIKIYIRRTLSENKQIDVEENLSYYPAGSKMRKREFPNKDTVLNQHWQYWIRVNKHSLF